MKQAWKCNFELILRRNLGQFWQWRASAYLQDVQGSGGCPIPGSQVVAAVVVVLLLGAGGCLSKYMLSSVLSGENCNQEDCRCLCYLWTIQCSVSHPGKWSLGETHFSSMYKVAHHHNKEGALLQKPSFSWYPPGEKSPRLLPLFAAPRGTVLGT